MSALFGDNDEVVVRLRDIQHDAKNKANLSENAHAAHVDEAEREVPDISEGLEAD